MHSRRVDDNEVRAVRQREKELRRSRGEISCAECRRLKLRCDKKVPCSSCRRRGCQRVCPNGTLTGGHGPRLVIPDSEKQHRKLLEMSERIRQLEDALEIAHGELADDPHPLLAEELLAIKHVFDTPEDTYAKAAAVGAQAMDRETLEAFGTLSVSEGGAEKFLGLSSGSSNVANTAPDPPEHPPEHYAGVLATLPPQLVELAKAWPFPPVASSPSEVRALIAAQLPSLEHATALCEAFLGNLTWFFRPIERDQLMDELLPKVYRRARAGGGEEPMMPPLAPESVPGSFRGYGSAYGLTAGASANRTASSGRDSLQSYQVEHQEPPVDMHELAVVLMCFAVGAIGDLTKTPINTEAELYAHLARAAMATQPISIFDGSLATVQAASLMGLYSAFSARSANFEPTWVVFYLAYSIAASLGLHRDPTRWRLDRKTVNRRRSLFWELFTINIWQSLSSGRPNFFCLHGNDVEFPEDDDTTVDEEGMIVPGYWRWKHKLIRDILASITERMAMASTMKYSDVLGMDRSLRKYHLESYRQPKPNVLSGTANESEILQHWTSSVFVDVVSLYIHRNFFAKAVLDHPANPLLSPYAPSFLSGYGAATTLLKSARELFTTHGAVLLRFWPLWPHLLSAVVMVASVVTRGPSSALAPAAFVELELAVSLFEKADAHPVARVGLPILQRLRKKAQLAIYEQQTNATTLQSSGRDDQATEQNNDMATLLEQPRALSVPSMKRRSPAGSSTPSSHHASSRHSPHLHEWAQKVVDRDDLVTSQIPQAVLDTNTISSANSAYPLTMPDVPLELPSGVHSQSEMYAFPGEYQALFGVPSTSGMPPADAAVEGRSMFSEPGPSWQHQHLPAPTAASSSTPAAKSASNTNLNLNALLLSYLTTPSPFVQTTQPAQSAQSTQPADSATASELRFPPPPVPPIDYAALVHGDINLQLPVDETMDDAWRAFVQSSGFEDPGIFEL